MRARNYIGRYTLGEIQFLVEMVYKKRYSIRRIRASCDELMSQRLIDEYIEDNQGMILRTFRLTVSGRAQIRELEQEAQVNSSIRDLHRTSLSPNV